MKGNLGTELKKIRNQKRIRLDKIESKLKINVKYLKLIEDNQLDFLHRPYVLAFVKAYANELGISADEAKEKFDQQLRLQFETPAVDININIQDNSSVTQISGNVSTPKQAQNIEFGNLIKTNQKTIVVSVVMILFLITLFLLQKNYFGPQDTTPIIQQTTQIPAEIHRSTFIDTSNRVTAINTPLELRLVTNDQLWLRMSVDSGTPSEYVFGENETRSWTAQERFELRIGKSVGFELCFNEDLLQKPGNENTMIGNLVLTKDGVSDISLLQQPPDTTIRR